MLNVMFWTTFGILVGWITAILQDTNGRATTTYVLIGAIGGLLGGYGGGLLDYNSGDYDATATGMMFAVFGAVSLVILAGLAADRRSQ